MATCPTAGAGAPATVLFEAPPFCGCHQLVPRPPHPPTTTTTTTTLLRNVPCAGPRACKWLQERQTSPRHIAPPAASVVTCLPSLIVPVPIVHCTKLLRTVRHKVCLRKKRQECTVCARASTHAGAAQTASLVWRCKRLCACRHLCFFSVWSYICGRPAAMGAWCRSRPLLGGAGQRRPASPATDPSPPWGRAALLP